MLIVNKMIISGSLSKLSASCNYAEWVSQRHSQILRCVWVLVIGLVVLPTTPLEAQQLTLDLEDYAAMPITAQPGGGRTMGQLSRVNFLRDEPGADRFFVNDLNGPLYILDKATRTFTPYLNFNGKDGQPGLFPRFIFEPNFATGLTNVIFDPDYANNGVFYTLHFEDPSIGGSAAPHPGVVDSLDLSGYETTTPIPPTLGYQGEIAAEVILIEWTDQNTANTTFEGTARELMRVEHINRIHPMGEMSFNPYAQPGDPDWRVMYLGVGDASTGDMSDDRRFLPQRLDSYMAKILRIVPDLDAHTTTSRVSENGRYRIPNDNPFASVDGTRGEVWATGVRNAHRLSWYQDPAQTTPYLLAYNIGSFMWETVLIIQKGENYGYPFREGTEGRARTSAEPRPDDDTLPVQISGTTERGTITPTYPVIAYKTNVDGDAIAGGFVYNGTSVPALQGKLVFGDITTGRIWYADWEDVVAADDGNPETLAPIREIEWNLRALTEETFQARGGEGETLPGVARASGFGRVDLRFAVDDEGEIYVLTKSDGMIRKVVGGR